MSICQRFVIEFCNFLQQKMNGPELNSNVETIQTFVPRNFTSQPKIIGFYPKGTKLDKTSHQGSSNLVHIYFVKLHHPVNPRDHISFVKHLRYFMIDFYFHSVHHSLVFNAVFSFIAEISKKFHGTLRRNEVAS